MQLLQQGLQPRRILRALRPEGVPEAFLGAGRAQPPLHPQPFQRAGEAEAGGDDADRAQDARRIGDDLVRRAGDPVAARGRGILDAGDDGDLLLLRQAADPPRHQAGLHRRATGRVDHQEDGRQALEAEGAVQHRAAGGQADAAAEAGTGGDGALQAHQRDAGMAGEEGNVHAPQRCARAAGHQAMRPGRGRAGAASGRARARPRGAAAKPLGYSGAAFTSEGEPRWPASFAAGATATIGLPGARKGGIGAGIVRGVVHLAGIGAWYSGLSIAARRRIGRAGRKRQQENDHDGREHRCARRIT